MPPRFLVQQRAKTFVPIFTARTILLTYIFLFLVRFVIIYIIMHALGFTRTFTKVESR